MSLLALMLLAQVHVDIALPSISFPAPPPLVLVTPGVQVVEDNDDEIYFVDSWYWHRREGHWFRTRDHRGHWAVVEERYVPVAIVREPPGRYRRWKRIEHEVRKEEKRERKEEKREEKREKKHK